MKNILLPLLFIIITNTLNSQHIQEQCESPKIEENDLNSITKCSIEKIEDDKNKSNVILNISSYKTNKKTASHIIRRKRKKSAINNQKLSNSIDKNLGTIELKNNIIEKKLTSENILFSLVDEKPTFKNCEKASIKNKTNCFNSEISNHFSKNFYPERASEDGINGKVFIQFTIDVHGNVNNLRIKANTKSQDLENEIARVINKLPKLSPGKHRGLPVNVIYNLPINFTSN
ncbi:energy transducer TonB [Tenacibaculum sp. IB213877]|uniref:energy transducer TonB n=1 Tax=Tenacibaculum sp. IB213877 TaxID=3097351 RepID=UPI002A5AE3B8|nr:energy transducer TonB [Tenacibaculum sp. IB213877]MDY0781656.1 energy transducer TonB [Tenacibaculum sp. IB213877]